MLTDTATFLTDYLYRINREIAWSVLLFCRIILLHHCHRLFDQLFQCGKVDILKLVDVKAGLSGFVFAELGHEFIILGKARHDIKREVLLAG